jgi:hypothetical protein
MPRSDKRLRVSTTRLFATTGPYAGDTAAGKNLYKFFR